MEESEEVPSGRVVEEFKGVDEVADVDHPHEIAHMVDLGVSSNEVQLFQEVNEEETHIDRGHH